MRSCRRCSERIAQSQASEAMHLQGRHNLHWASFQCDGVLPQINLLGMLMTKANSRSSIGCMVGCPAEAQRQCEGSISAQGQAAEGDVRPGHRRARHGGAADLRGVPHALRCDCLACRLVHSGRVYAPAMSVTGITSHAVSSLHVFAFCCPRWLTLMLYIYICIYI